MASAVSTSLEEPHVERIHTFDLMRGFFLIVILLDHLSYYPSGLDIFTGGGILYVSAAEGFFVISGIVLGIVRGRKLIKKPFDIAAKLLLKRGLQLYVEAVILTLIFTLIGWLFYGNANLKYGIATPDLSLWEIVWRTITLQYSYGWADFLRYYALFLAGAPIALWLLRRGKWYIVTLINIVIWRYYAETPGGERWLPLSWQLIFYSGFIIGFYWPTLTRWWRRGLSTKQRLIISRILTALFIVCVAISFMLVFNRTLEWLRVEPYLSWHNKIAPYFDKDRLPWQRLALGTVVFWGIFATIRRHEGWFMKRLGWLFLPLGQNSLYVYTIESFVIFFAHLFIIPPQAWVKNVPWYINLSLSLAAIALVWFATRKKFLFSIIPR